MVSCRSRATAARTWTNVTPAGVGVGLANEVEVSPHDAATVYLAFRMDRRGDYTPYAFKSTDYGKTWTPIVKGFRAGEPVRVVREDPERRGLLYAGTETGVYVSFDGGANWQTLSRNLPVVPVADLEVRHGDLYAATEGRAFWALDDLSPLRQMNQQVTASAVHLFTPRPAQLGGGGSGASTSAGRNPPAGANVYYSLATVPDSAAAMKLEFLDGAGKGAAELRALVRQCAAGSGAPAGFGGAPPRPRLEPKAGLNAFQWDLRAEPPTTLPGGISMFGGPTNGYLVAPGRYQVRLTVGSTVLTQPLEVRLDPRQTISAAEVAARDTMMRTTQRARVGDQRRADPHPRREGAGDALRRPREGRT